MLAATIGVFGFGVTYTGCEAGRVIFGLPLSRFTQD